MCQIEGDIGSSGLSPKAASPLLMPPPLKSLQEERKEEGRRQAFVHTARNYMRNIIHEIDDARLRYNSSSEQCDSGVFLAENEARLRSCAEKSPASSKVFPPSQANMPSGPSNIYTEPNSLHGQPLRLPSFTFNRPSKLIIPKYSLPAVAKMDSFYQTDLLDLEAPVERFTFVPQNRQLDCVPDGWTLPEQEHFPHLSLDQLRARERMLPLMIKISVESAKDNTAVLKWLKTVEQPTEISMPDITEHSEASSEDAGEEMALQVAKSTGSSDAVMKDDHYVENLSDVKPSSPSATAASSPSLAAGTEEHLLLPGLETISNKPEPGPNVVPAVVSDQPMVSSSEPSFSFESNTPQSLADDSATMMPSLKPTLARTTVKPTTDHSSFSHLNPFARKTEPEGTDLMGFD